uniref:Interleukin-6 n=1 Tax=Scleropages formosus TaxID=113540 RepID=A0A8C9RI70_SCLFO
MQSKWNTSAALRSRSDCLIGFGAGLTRSPPLALPVPLPFLPVASLALLLLSALGARATPCLSTGADMSEISGDELPEVSGDAPAKWESLAGALVFWFVFFFPSSSSNYLSVRLTAHVQKRCLQRVADGLQRYQVYLEFVEKEFPQQSRVRDIMNKASSLVHIIREKVSAVRCGAVRPVPERSCNQLLGELPSSSRWSRSISVHGVLSRMSAFAADAFRAIRYINQRLRRGRP